MENQITLDFTGAEDVQEMFSGVSPGDKVSVKVSATVREAEEGGMVADVDEVVSVSTVDSGDSAPSEMTSGTPAAIIVMGKKKDGK